MRFPRLRQSYWNTGPSRRPLTTPLQPSSPHPLTGSPHPTPPVTSTGESTQDLYWKSGYNIFMRGEIYSC